MSSLVEVEPLSLAKPEASLPQTGGQTPDRAEPQRETNLLHLVWKGRWLILFCMLLGAGAAWAVLQRATPLYKSMSRIYVERALPQVLTTELQSAQSASYLYTQAELIRSTPVLAAAAQSPDCAKIESFRGVDNPVALLQKCITVTVGQQDDIINVAGELPNAADSAAVVRAVVEAYISKYAENRRSNTVEVLKILRSEKTRRDDELELRRKELADFRKANPALALQVDKENIVTRRFAKLSEQLNQTEIELLEARARYQRTKELFAQPSERMRLLETASKQSTATRDVDLENLIRQVEQQLAAERAQWGEGHPRVRLLRESATELRKRLKQQQEAILTAYLDGLRQEFEILEQKQKELRTEYDHQFQSATELGTAALQLAALEEAYKRCEEQCDIFDSRIKQVNLSEDASAKLNVNILEAASIPVLPSYPIPSRFLILGILGGGMVGFGLTWVRNLLDHRLKTVDEISSVLQLPVLGALPYFGDPHDKSPTGRLVMLTPRSPAAEAVRTLRTALHFGFAGRDGVKAIVVTSPAPGDGKSTVASNLAIAMAQADQRVLLIDADLRKPTQHLIHEVSAERGLATVLTERRPVAEAIIPHVLDNLDLLPCGKLPNNPVELLNNGFFAELLEKLRDRYDRVIIDAPPVVPLADSRVIAALADATLLVLRAEQSTRRIALAARDELWRVRATRIGVVVNGVPMRHTAYGYGYGYGYGESYSYGQVSYAAPEENGRKSKRPALLAKKDGEPVSSGSEQE
ncbi:MAG: polysaccharide biosynthesis tyrosine autokinase [Pirellulales bacterium]